LNKTIVIIRHAHRDFYENREQDNGLSPKGRRQVRKLFDFYFKRFPDMDKPLLWSSPKRRCKETLLPLASKLEQRLLEKEELDEQGPKENAKEFNARVGRTLKELKSSKSPLIILCSHGDWIPVFLKKACGLKLKLKKGGWAELEWEEGKAFRLTWLIQSLS